ncbi:MAG: hypothetical protein H6624_15740 [Bdellovibrionaceae bacterium]|nr:hypothetical protein [Bdellovibrionales bacterium]MCB9085799.1 hypothetical protein [Pseudobdellovibrionaceae bacterium]
MASGDWLVNLGDFLKYYNITPNMLLFFSAVVLIAFVFSLREFMSWLSKTSSLRRDLATMKHTLNIMEQKIDALLAMRMGDSMKSEEMDDFILKKPLKKRPEKKTFDISH